MSKTVSNEILEKALQIYIETKKDDKANAEYNGEMGDRGYSHAMELVAAYNAGRNNIVPSFLEKYIEEATLQMTDPNYVKYLYLKRKYGNR